MTDSEPTALRQLILVTGPARSGKSEWAESRAAGSGKQVIYVATGLVDETDLEWMRRLEQHRNRRLVDWETLEVPIELPAVVRSASASDCLLIDSVGTWTANLLEQEAQVWTTAQGDLLGALKSTAADIILVGEETGWGVVPAYPAGRLFRDRLGTLVRRIGAIADAVYLVTGGYALDLSALGTPLPPANN
ncbi:bifunctional adenosylcobinamide kinase/adenosylcobinamide-phosphate guanylyltransferase [Tychonema sp. LEGE 07203]|uniref:bifunctional adenosylcobinamide kinase/adenosylcobinamide-phosphate guanylyltransferase n=1 Tax=Tychonema sp. LEGE 07203 TaxID=1828671 RepID=UPI00188101B0|nr:bifunctional adenosylcobinamide kinase/adenosylcobinamide-phosphate guanylyltransferase [Tychonema sp. LEGE 07203]MBE9092759.1 bifunctional adenosylcobinamide kinase/adenosylcobinamide-phosphate guanylyltransferase [Tychonema sp. LEGE 07203]